MAPVRGRPVTGGRFSEVGLTGLRQFSGYLDEEWYRRLRGKQARRVFRDMADNDATVGSLLFAIEMLIRNVEWRVEPYSDDPVHREQSEFVETLMEDMSHTWEDLIAEILQMLVYGFSPFEIVYKRRDGADQADPRRRSRYDDGKIGWRKLAPRSAETVDQWDFDDDNEVKGFWQEDPNGGPRVYLPVEKTMIFRTTSRKNNPEGRSILRSAYVAWYHKTRIQTVEAIGIERDLAGLPVFHVPGQLFDENASPQEKAQLAMFKDVVKNLKNDEQAGLIIPSDYDPETNQPYYKFELASTGSTRTFNTNDTINRYSRDIAMTVLADFILLGHEKVGSFALSDDKTDTFATAVGAWLSDMASVLNRHGLPKLYAFNAWNPAETAQFVPGDLEKPDLERFARAVTDLTTAGFLTPGAEEDEEHVRSIMDLPPPSIDRDDLMDDLGPDDAGLPQLPGDSRPPSPGSTNGTGQEPGTLEETDV